MGEDHGRVTPVPALVLAAGLGTRFLSAGGRGPKVLAELDGRPLLAHVVDRARSAGASPMVLVVQPDLVDAPALTPLTSASDVRAVVNAHPEDGLSTSLAVGLSALLADGDAEACVVLVGDQPGIDPEVVATVMGTWRRTGRPVRTRYSDGESHPVLLPRDLWPTLIAASAAEDEGARTLLATTELAIVEVDGPAPRDVDVPGDIAALAAQGPERAGS